MKTKIVFFLLVVFSLISAISCKAKKDLNSKIQCFGIVEYHEYPNMIELRYKFQNTSDKEIKAFKMLYYGMDEFGKVVSTREIVVNSNCRIYDVTYNHILGDKDDKQDEYRAFSVKSGENFLVSFTYWDNPSDNSVTAWSEKWMNVNNYKDKVKTNFKYKVTDIIFTDGTSLKI